MKEKIILKSTHQDEYPDLIVECRVIPNDKIGEYLATIPADKKFYAYKNGVVSARVGVPGEKIITTLKTVVGDKEYILSEEENTVKERDGYSDIVVRNLDSTSNEQYVVKHSKFCQTYEPYDVRQCACGQSARYLPVVETRLLTQVDENLIIMTAWGAPAVCLAGSYIVTYNAEENDYNTLEQGAFNSTYQKEDTFQKKLKK